MIRRLDARIIITLLITTLTPLGVSVYLVSKTINTTIGIGLNKDVAAQLEQNLEIYRKYIEAIKQSQKVKLIQVTDSAALKEAVDQLDESKIKRVFERFLQEDPSLRGIRIETPSGRSIEIKAVSTPILKADRIVEKQAPLNMPPYNNIVLSFGINPKITSAYRDANQHAKTYGALLSAPPNYLEKRIISVYLILLGVVVALSVGVGIGGTRLLVRRIHALSEATHLVAQGDLNVQVDPGSKDEVGDLIESFNGMVSQLASSNARIEYLQKISAWQEMARRLAHEIKNPLTPIHLVAQQLRDKCDIEDKKFSRLVEQSTEIIEEEVTTLRRLVSDFSQFAKLPQVSPEQVNLKEFLEECQSSMAHMSDNNGVNLIWELPDTQIELAIDKMMFKRVMDNLVRNATEALTNAGVELPSITIFTQMRKTRKKREIEIHVKDNGPGILPEHHASIFDPYFTTKTEGTGLGLAISKKIVLEHGGKIWIDDESSSGADFTIVLPLS